MADENIVKFQLSAGLFAVLMQELYFCQSVATRSDINHSRANAEILYRELFKQTGVSLVSDETEALAAGSPHHS